MDALIDEIEFVVRFDTSEMLRCEKVTIAGTYKYGAQKWKRDYRKMTVSIPTFNGFVADVLRFEVFKTKPEADYAIGKLREWRSRREMVKDLGCSRAKAHLAAQMLIRGQSSADVRAYFKEDSKRCA